MFLARLEPAISFITIPVTDKSKKIKVKSKKIKVKR